MLALEQQANELQAVVDGLEAASGEGDSAALLPLLGASLSGGLGSSTLLTGAAGGGLPEVPAALLRAVASAAAAQPQRSIAAGAAVGRLHGGGGGGGLGWPSLQAGGSGASSGSAAPAPPVLGAAPGPYQKRAHDPASCTAPNCRLCAYEQRLQQRAGKAAAAQQPHTPFHQPSLDPPPQQQQQGAGQPAALGPDPSDAMAKAALEASGLLENHGLVSGGLSAPLLDALLHNLPSLPTLLPHPPPS